MWRIFLWFHIRRSERKRLILLLLLLVGFSFLSKWTRERVFDRSEEVAKYTSLLDSTIRVQDSIRLYEQESFYDAGPYKVEDLTVREWSASGLSNSESSRLFNYLQAGGRIYNEESFRRINLGDSIWRRRITEVLVIEAKETRDDYALSNNWEASWKIELLKGVVNVHQPDSISLVKSGVPIYMVTRWKKYVGSGVRFDSLAEVLSIWGMDTTWYSLNRDSLTLGDVVEDKLLSLQMNLATEEDLSNILMYEWQQKKWIDYRKRLGGYIDTSQFWECGLDSNSVRKLLRQSWKKGEVQKLNLNTATIEELNRHPYIGWRRAKTIEYYRTRVRPIEDPEVLIGLEGWTEADVQRLREYLE